MKDCPFCAQRIAEAALVCRYCGSDLPGHERELSELRGSSSAGVKRPLVITAGLSLLFTGLFVVPRGIRSLDLEAGLQAVSVYDLLGLAFGSTVYFFMFLTPLAALGYGIALLMNGEPVYRAVGLFVFLSLILLSAIFVLLYMLPALNPALEYNL